MSQDYLPGQPVISLVGQTATGKTDLGVYIARHIGGEVISADSQQVYQELNIGTAKPTEAEMQGVPHHLLDFLLPTETYSVAKYAEDATRILNHLVKTRKTPIVVGGTGLYIKALLEEAFVPPVPPDKHFRAEMARLAEQRGKEHLYQLLLGRDPERAAALHPNDSFRVIRALEIIHQTGLPVPKEAKPLGRNVIWIGLTRSDRDHHRKLIDDRIQAMLDAGWLDEVRTLMNQYGPDAEALRVAHGYPEWVGYLQGKRTFEDALRQVQINVHQYARRQMTWFRRNPDIYWVEADEARTPEGLTEVLAYVKQTLTY